MTCRKGRRGAEQAGLHGRGFELLANATFSINLDNIVN
jgi:hypothetical protein